MWRLVSSGLAVALVSSCSYIAPFADPSGSDGGQVEAGLDADQTDTDGLGPVPDCEPPAQVPERVRDNDCPWVDAGGLRPLVITGDCSVVMEGVECRLRCPEVDEDQQPCGVTDFSLHDEAQDRGTICSLAVQSFFLGPTATLTVGPRAGIGIAAAESIVIEGQILAHGRGRDQSAAGWPGGAPGEPGWGPDEPGDPPPLWLGQGLAGADGGGGGGGGFAYGGGAGGCSGGGPGGQASPMTEWGCEAQTLASGVGGGGGGSSGPCSPGSAGSGGAGGGLVFLYAEETITIESNSEINADGADGTQGQCEQAGGGGGGSGGYVRIAAPRVTVRGRVSAIGGKGGDSGSGEAGGAGGGTETGGLPQVGGGDGGCGDGAGSGGGAGGSAGLVIINARQRYLDGVIHPYVPLCLTHPTLTCDGDAI